MWRRFKIGFSSVLFDAPLAEFAGFMTALLLLMCVVGAVLVGFGLFLRSLI